MLKRRVNEIWLFINDRLKLIASVNSGIGANRQSM